MTKISIEALARQQIKAAHHAGGRRAADTVFGGHEKVLRQTVIGLLKDAEIGERDNADEATIYVLEGRVQLWVGENFWEARQGSLLILPEARHRLVAIEDSALMLTVAKLGTAADEHRTAQGSQPIEETAPAQPDDAGRAVPGSKEPSHS